MAVRASGVLAFLALLLAAVGLATVYPTRFSDSVEVHEQLAAKPGPVRLSTIVVRSGAHASAGLVSNDSDCRSACFALKHSADGPACFVQNVQALANNSALSYASSTLLSAC